MTELEFKSLAQQGYNRIPLIAEAFADLETPLTLYLKLAQTQQGGKNTFLLESVVGGERFGRYSFIGLPATTVLRSYGSRTEIVKNGAVIAEAQLKTPVILDEVRAGGRIPLIIGRGLTAKAREALGLPVSTLFRLPQSPNDPGKGYTLAQKIVGRACGLPEGQGVRPGGEVGAFFLRQTGGDEAKNKELFKANVLYDHETLPLGEFAIGTNTTAYVFANKHDIVYKLPILIVEKMGPHFAVGDTCYSRAEDVYVTNPDGKEIISRDNEVSLLRKTDPDKAYYNCHTDITIPYDEIGRISVVDYSGKETSIIENGRFVLSGTDMLNEPFED